LRISRGSNALPCNKGEKAISRIAIKDIIQRPDKSFCLAQNGIAENFQQLKKKLIKKGYKFQTETDTEVIVRLIEDKKTNDLKEAVRMAFLELEGRNTIIVLSKDGQIIACRNGSPLVIGLTESEVFLSSDTLSFAPHTNNLVVVENGQMASWDGKKLELTDLKSGQNLKYKAEKVNFKTSKVDKEGYDHFMSKEIFESPYVINQVLNQDLDQYKEFRHSYQARHIRWE